MNPKKAAEHIGCSVQQVRTMIRTGKLKAKKIVTEHNQHGYEYQISAAEADRVKNNPPARGWQRGRKRGPRETTQPQTS